MDPLVDEYNKNESKKGTELKSMRIAEQKAEAFTYKLFTVNLCLLAVEIIHKLV